MSRKTQIIADQRNWAQSAGLRPNEKGYLPNYRLNLFQPMSTKTRQAFDKGSGSELKDTPKYPAKMRAAHSSSALVVNVFDVWVEIDSALLLSALGLETKSAVGVRFEEQYPTGLPGNPPNLDVVLELVDGYVIAIESKFTEWLAPKSTRKPPFKQKYFPEGSGVWAQKGIPITQALAEAIQSGSIVFRHLDAPQLIKHALGLAIHLGGKFKLFYIFFNCSGTESAAHKSEIKQFSEHVGSELGFHALSYQDLFLRLSGSKAGPPEYRNYLRSRYFANAA